MKPFVLLDNGHGSDTRGKCSPDGRYYEWEWTRRAAGAIRERLLRDGIDCHLLVPEDTDVPLAERCRRSMAPANLYPDAILVSLHSNASTMGYDWGRASGWSAWVSHNASERSRRLASLLTDEARRRSLLGNRATPPEGYCTANYAICRDTPCPAVLTENMFHDNRDDVDFLLSDEGTGIIADLHVAAIKEYYGL